MGALGDSYLYSSWIAPSNGVELGNGKLEINLDKYRPS